MTGSEQSAPRPGTGEPVAAKLQHALALHQQGDLARAEALYREILTGSPDQPDALQLLGVATMQRGEPATALELLQRAVRHDAARPVAHMEIGRALRALRRPAEALASFERALALKPEYVECLVNRGNVLLDLGRPQEALASYDRALAIRPDDAVALNNQGNALRALKRPAEALACHERALVLDPSYVHAHVNRGNALLELKRAAEALAAYDRALALEPRQVEALNNRGNALLELKRHEEALASFDRALAIDPDYAEAHNNRGLVLLALKRPEAALASHERALALAPGDARAYHNCANALRKLKKPDQALAHYERALALQPEYVQAIVNRAGALCELLRTDEALACYARAQALAPEDPAANWNEALCRLLTGDFAAGWRKYEWRWRELFAQFKREFPQPLWLGREDLRGATILLHAEQGLGDTIQFCRYAAEVARLGAAVLLEVQPALKPLLGGLRGATALFARGEPLPGFDFHCPLLSLPLALGTTLQTIPRSVPYLEAAPQLVSQWEERLSPFGGFRIGIGWQGNPDYVSDHYRSPPLRHFAGLSQVEGVRLVSLQKGAGAEQLRGSAAALPVSDFGDDLDGAAGPFMDTAAILCDLDLVVTSDTALAHLAGALAVPVWVVLPYCPDWRWLLGREDCPWYPTMRLFRQKRLDDWGGVFTDVRAAVLERLNEIDKLP
jgi:tetratricopeptide (TPR) repeat protein